MAATLKPKPTSNNARPSSNKPLLIGMLPAMKLLIVMRLVDPVAP